MTRLYRTRTGPILEKGGRHYRLDPRDRGAAEGGLGARDGEIWDLLINRDDLATFLDEATGQGQPLEAGFRIEDAGLLPPIGSQEVWAAGVTYFRSRDARMEESSAAGGGSHYDRVYTADRPELFFKATPHRVVGHGGRVRVRSDSRWSVPEPELTLLVTTTGKIVGLTIGNDMSARDIEGENPLYLPQAKTYDGSCALGPGILVVGEDISSETAISLAIFRSGAVVFEGSTTRAELRRSPRELVDYLYRESTFPRGCFLMTGTGIVPPPSFALASGDEIRISVDGIGTLTNCVA